MRNHIKYLVLALLLLGCKNYKSLTTQIDKNKAIPYNQYSQEFQAWEATKNIKLEEAYQIHLGYAAKNQDKIKLKSTKGYPLYYVYDDYYIFSTVTYIHKIGIFNSFIGKNGGCFIDNTIYSNSFYRFFVTFGVRFSIN